MVFLIAPASPRSCLSPMTRKTSHTAFQILFFSCILVVRTGRLSAGDAEEMWVIMDRINLGSPDVPLTGIIGSFKIDREKNRYTMEILAGHGRFSITQRGIFSQSEGRTRFSATIECTATWAEAPLDCSRSVECTRVELIDVDPRTQFFQDCKGFPVLMSLRFAELRRDSHFCEDPIKRCTFAGHEMHWIKSADTHVIAGSGTTLAPAIARLTEIVQIPDGTECDMHAKTRINGIWYYFASCQLTSADPLDIRFGWLLPQGLSFKNILPEELGPPKVPDWFER